MKLFYHIGVEITMIEIDVRGLSCPLPVVKILKAINEHPNDELVVLVETRVTGENMSRMAQSKGYTIKTGETGDGFHLCLTPPVK